MKLLLSIKLYGNPIKCNYFQVAALGAISNILVDFTRGKSTFVQCGGVKQLIQLSKSMDSAVRLNALWALKNMVFLADDRFKQGIFMEFTASLLTSLICGNAYCICNY